MYMYTVISAGFLQINNGAFSEFSIYKQNTFVNAMKCDK